MQRVCLVGADCLSKVHAEILAGLEDVVLSAAVDPHPHSARPLAEHCRTGGDILVDKTLGAGTFDRAPFLVPLSAGIEGLLHIGSMAGFFFGAQHAPVTGTTPPELYAELPAPCERAKALSDLLGVHTRAS